MSLPTLPKDLRTEWNTILDLRISSAWRDPVLRLETIDVSEENSMLESLQIPQRETFQNRDQMHLKIGTQTDFCGRQGGFHDRIRALANASTDSDIWTGEPRESPPHVGCHVYEGGEQGDTGRC